MDTKNYTDEIHYLEWQGPFSLQGKGELLFNSPVSNKPGIYLFTVEYQDGYLIYSAGLTTRTFKRRFREHIKAYQTGIYTIFDAKKFQNGERIKIWRGFWFQKRTNNMEEEFQIRQEEIKCATGELLSTFRVFLAPLEVEKRVLERLEAAIMNTLYSGTGTVSNLPDRGMHLAPRRANEESFLAHNSSKVYLHGLPKTFKA